MINRRLYIKYTYYGRYGRLIIESNRRPRAARFVKRTNEATDNFAKNVFLYFLLHDSSMVALQGTTTTVLPPCINGETFIMYEIYVRVLSESLYA